LLRLLLCSAGSAAESRFIYRLSVAQPRLHGASGFRTLRSNRRLHPSRLSCPERLLGVTGLQELTSYWGLSVRRGRELSDLASESAISGRPRPDVCVRKHQYFFAHRPCWGCTRLSRKTCLPARMCCPGWRHRPEALEAVSFPRRIESRTLFSAGHNFSSFAPVYAATSSSCIRRRACACAQSLVFHIQNSAVARKKRRVRCVLLG